MIEMKSAEQRLFHHCHVLSPLHGATESLKKRKKAWSNSFCRPATKAPPRRGTLDFTLGEYVPLGWNP